VKVAVTGASGFIGRELANTLKLFGHEAIPLHRDSAPIDRPGLGPYWLRELRGAKAVIHLAGRAHVLKESSTDSLAEFRRANVEYSVAVAKAAAEAGVARMVFVSSIGVLGQSCGEYPFNDSCLPSPAENYAISKYEAERELTSLTAERGLELVILRPPLVYGAYVRGNFLRLLKLVRSGLPLPFGSAKSQRSFIGVTNLTELLTICAFDPRVIGRAFVVSDGEDISVTQLLRDLQAMMNQPPRVFSCPQSLLRTGAKLLGRSESLNKIMEPLRVDSLGIRQALQWTPSKSLHQGLHEMVDWYMGGLSDG
jgi:nucleoside-diphosphate-sugar epimerase